MHTADLLSSPFIYNVFKTAKSPFGMFSEAVKWLQKSRVSLAIMCTSRSEAKRQVMPKKKEVVATNGRMCMGTQGGEVHMTS